MSRIEIMWFEVISAMEWKDKMLNIRENKCPTLKVGSWCLTNTFSTMLSKSNRSQQSEYILNSKLEHVKTMTTMMTLNK